MNIPNATAVQTVQQRVPSPDSAGSTRLPAGSSQTAPLPAQNATDRPNTGTDKDGLLEAVRQVEKFVALANSEISFSVDEDTGMSIVKVIDKATDQVIRQIPSEEVVAIARTLDKLQGLLFTGKA